MEHLLIWCMLSSDKLSVSNSTLTVELNGNRIGTAPIGENMAGEQVFRIPLRKDDIQVGAGEFHPPGKCAAIRTGLRQL